MIVRFAPQNLGELLDRIGNVPAERIGMDPPPGRATEADVLRHLESADKRLYELVDGTLVEKAVGSRESMIAGEILTFFNNRIRGRDLGVVLGGDGAVRLMPGNIRYPDVSFIAWGAFPNDDLPEEAIWSVTPTLAVEVLSRSNTRREIERKLYDLFTTGCKMAWIIDPTTESARVYSSVTRFKDLDTAGVLDGGKILPGFKLPLVDLFAATKRRKKKSK
ncbi:MAG TPA: Uma2 family endonuclease [Fimbriiglobus sp.]|jgi:Uma2 family endonuclease